MPRMQRISSSNPTEYTSMTGFVPLTLQRQQISPDEKFIEYWVYQDGSNGTIKSNDGAYEEGKKKTERTLKCVVVCDNEPSHIIKDLEKHFLLKGYIFNDVDSPALTDYLGRS